MRLRLPSPSLTQTPIQLSPRLTCPIAGVAMEMIVFDVDGTLLGGEHHDWKSFDDAFEEAAGFSFPPDFFTNISEVTAEAIVHQALADVSHPDKTRIIDEARRGYLARNREAHENTNGAFVRTRGVHELWEDLRDREIPFAIATGDWHETISYKLSVAGIDMQGVPMATSSDCYARADIIRTAVERAGGELSASVYVGDGVWDLKATQRLGIPFIGCGSRPDELRAAGATHVLDDLHPERFWPAYHAVTSR